MSANDSLHGLHCVSKRAKRYVTQCACSARFNIPLNILVNRRRWVTYLKWEVSETSNTE